MGALKTKIMELTEDLNVSLSDYLTPDDEDYLYMVAQEVFSEGAQTQEELNTMFQFLPTITTNECGGRSGEVYRDRNGTFFLVV